MTDNIFPIDPNMVFDEITGTWYNPTHYPDIEPEFWVISKDYGPSGIAQAIAKFASESAAKRFQLEKGISSSTKIISFF